MRRFARDVGDHLPDLLDLSRADVTSKIPGRREAAVAAIDKDTPIAYVRTCRTCGQDYEGRTCPHCEQVRRRLRG